MEVLANKIWFNDEKMFVELNNNWIVEALLKDYPRLQNANASEREAFELWENGKWIHWEALDEDLSAEGFLTHPSLG